MFGKECKKMACGETYIELLNNVPNFNDAQPTAWSIAFWNKDPNGEDQTPPAECIAAIPCTNEAMARHIFQEAI